MCAPDYPDPPDPYETASAQTQQNIGTAVANSYMQNVNQYGPEGSRTWNVGSTYQYTDPNSGAVYDIPRWEENVQLSPAQQAIYNTNTQTRQNLADLGQSQSARLNDLLGSPFDLGNLPARNNYGALPTYGVQAPTFNAGPQLSYGQNLNTGGASGGNILSGFGQTKSKIPTVLPDAPSMAGMGTIQKSLDQSKIGKINSTFSGGGGVKTSFDDAGPITKTYNTDFSEDRRRVEEALMSRLNPSLEMDRETLRTQLVNQGIGIGSEAYDREMETFGQQSNDARMQAILAGGQEQSRMVGLEADRAQFQNNAQNQNYAQLADRARFANEGSALSFQQAAARAQYELAAQQQGYGQLYQQAALNNAGIAQDWGQRMDQANFGQNNFSLGLQAQGQEYGQLFDRAQFSNAAQAQRYGQNRLNIDSANAAQQQMNQNYNTSAQQMYNNYFNAGQANFDNANTAFGQNFNAEMARANAENQNRAASLQEAYAARNQPINEITSLMSGAQVSMPQFSTPNMPGIPTVDQAGLIQQDFQNQMGIANAQNAYNQNLWGGVLGGFGSLLGNEALLSDRRAKTDISKVGKAGGHNIYKYRYKDGGPFQLGVMAQEVEKKRPDAVMRGPDGLRRVNYDSLFELGKAA